MKSSTTEPVFRYSMPTPLLTTVCNLIEGRMGFDSLEELIKHRMTIIVIQEVEKALSAVLLNISQRLPIQVLPGHCQCLFHSQFLVHYYQQHCLRVRPFRLLVHFSSLRILDGIRWLDLSVRCHVASHLATASFFSSLPRACPLMTEYKSNCPSLVRLLGPPLAPIVVRCW